MIILPDKNIPRAKILMPVHKKEWRTPSKAQLKDQLNNENRTLFGITARLSDGYVKWRGMFEDRDDFDAFLFAMANDTLKYERALWDLPNARWDPEVSIGTVYEFVTYSYITTPNNGTNGTYNVPSDWNNSNNAIRGIGGGGSGASVTSTGVTAHAQGGSAGEYRRITNYTATPGGTVTYQVGRASSATGIVQSTNFISVSSLAALATTWNTTSLVANPGLAGGGSTTSGASIALKSGGTGGTGAGGNFNGGSAVALSNNGSASGGAGAGGTTAAGTNNATIAATNTSGNGGAGGATNGGSAGVAAGATGGVGGNGTGFEGVSGAGGGGAGAQVSNATAVAGNGGNYGSGGGGAAVRNVSASRQSTGGNGIAGIIVVSYEPVLTSTVWTNMPILGM